MFSVAMNVQRSIVIEKPIDDVFQIVADFASWRHWSPWLCQEPDCPVEIKEHPGAVGHSQHWNGKRIGSGQLMISSINSPHRIDFDLQFLRPWKSQSKVAFEFRTEGNATRVTWYMWGGLPIFLFFMRKSMIALISNDYDRGLSMLKELCETSEVHSLSRVVGEVDADPFFYIGVMRHCVRREVGELMTNDFASLGGAVESGNLPKPDFALTFYKKFDLMVQEVEYVAGPGYFNLPTDQVAGDYVSGHIAGHRAICVEHKGAYRHLSNAWTTAHGYVRANKQKPAKAISNYEIYDNMPGEVTEKSLSTRVFIPVQ